MPNQLLDAPIQDSAHKIRKPYFDVVEYAIMISNGMILFFGIGGCWMVVLNGGTWVFILNPPVFIVLFCYTPLGYMLHWRKASIAYEQRGEKQGLINLKGNFMTFVRWVTTALWSVLLITGVPYLLKVEEDVSYLVVAVGLLVLFIVGPVQTWFVARVMKIRDKTIGSFDNQ